MRHLPVRGRAADAGAPGSVPEGLRVSRSPKAMSQQRMREGTPSRTLYDPCDAQESGPGRTHAGGSERAGRASRRQGLRGGSAREDRPAGGAPRGGARPRPGARGGAGGRASGQPGLRAQQGEADPRNRHGLLRAPSRRRHLRGGAARTGAAPERRSRGQRHPRTASAARPHTGRSGDRGHRPREGRGRLPHPQRRPARDRSAGHGALYAARLSDAAERPPGRSPGRPGARARALEHRRQADGPASARGALHGHHRALAHPRPRRRMPARRHPGRGGGTGEDGARGLDQARGHGHRRRHQPRRHRKRRPASGRRRRFRGRQAARRGDHPGAGRRRSDDHRLPAAQHPGRRLPAAPHPGRGLLAAVSAPGPSPHRPPLRPPMRGRPLPLRPGSGGRPRPGPMSAGGCPALTGTGRVPWG